MTSRLQQLEKENSDLKKVTDELRALVLSLDSRVKALEGTKSAPQTSAQPPKPVEKEEKKEEEDDDDVDLFGDDDEDDEEAERIKQERVAAYAARKEKSKLVLILWHFDVLHCCLISEPALIAKSNIILDVKPWDDETDMKEVEAQVRKIEADGLLWGAGKFFAIVMFHWIMLIQCSVSHSQIGAIGLWNQETTDFHCCWRWQDFCWLACGNYPGNWRLGPECWYCCFQQDLNWIFITAVSLLFRFGCNK